MRPPDRPAAVSALACVKGDHVKAENPMAVTRVLRRVNRPEHPVSRTCSTEELPIMNHEAPNGVTTAGSPIVDAKKRSMSSMPILSTDVVDVHCAARRGIACAICDRHGGATGLLDVHYGLRSARRVARCRPKHRARGKRCDLRCARGEPARSAILRRLVVGLERRCLVSTVRIERKQGRELRAGNAAQSHPLFRTWTNAKTFCNRLSPGNPARGRAPWPDSGTSLKVARAGRGWSRTRRRTGNLRGWTANRCP